MNNSRILMIAQNRGRGSGTTLHAQATYAAHNGYQVAVAHAGNNRSNMEYLNLDLDLNGLPVPVHESLPSAGSHQKPVYVMDEEEARIYIDLFHKKIDEVISEFRPDIILINHANIIAVAAAEVATSKGIPYGLFAHGTGLEPRINKDLYQRNYDDSVWKDIARAVKNAKRIMVSTNYVRDHLLLPAIGKDVMGITDVVPLWIDPRQFQGELPKTNVPLQDYIFTPGAYTSTKGAQNVAEAAVYHYDQTRMSTIFTGDGPLRKSLERILGHRGEVRGFVSIEERNALFRNASLLVEAPNKREHFGMVFVEGMQTSTPSIVYEGGGPDDILQKSEGTYVEGIGTITPVGVLVERDIHSLANAILYLTKNQKHREDMANNAGKRGKLYTPDELGPRFLEFLDCIKK